MNKPQKIRWLIAHEPIELFLRTAKAFSEKIAELTDNQFEVEIFTPSTYKFTNDTIFDKTVKSGSISRDLNGPMVELDAGNIEMSQLHAAEIGGWHDQSYLALEMPFLFSDHNHAARVFEGTIGKELLSGLSEKSPARGLAFTYSGGFRCIASDEKIKNLDDLKSLTFTTGINPVAIDTARALGCQVEPMPIRDQSKVILEKGQGAKVLETTIPRYLAQFSNSTKKYLTNTKHSLFLTTIVVSNSFWNSLDKDTQDKFQEASLYASRLERKWSVEESEDFAAKDNHDDIGVTYTELSDSDTEKFKELTKPLYTKYKDVFYPGLIDGILKS
jgi:TRAP-type C4-dicarboxylate transport system substrate-binding protein